MLLTVINYDNNKLFHFDMKFNEKNKWKHITNGNT